jgi:hypothetical protein
MPLDAQELRSHIDAIVAASDDKASGNEISLDIVKWLRSKRENWADATLVQIIADLLADDDRDRPGSPARARRIRTALLLLSVASELRVRAAFMPEMRRALERLTVPGFDQKISLMEFDALNGAHR